MVCNSAQPELRVFDAAYAPATPPRKGDQVRRVEWSGLIIYGKEEVNDFHLRVGSRQKRLACGPWRLTVREGFYSASPGGRGGVITFPDLTVHAGRRQILRTQLDAGDETKDTSDECSDMSQCPHTLILRSCAAPLREEDGACAKEHDAKANRLFIERRWYDEEKKAHRRVDALQ